jgi:hypothetical protein
MEKTEKGLRMGPTVQQGGVQTIQQSIYLIHDNPCGVNPILLGKLGSTNLTAEEFIEYLNTIILDEFTQSVRMGVLAAVQNYGNDPSVANHLAYLKALTNYARACAFRMLSLPPVPGYTYHFSLYDPSGAMIWDSYTPNLFVYKETGGVLSYSKVNLIANGFTGGGAGKTDIFQINERPYLLPYVNVISGTPAEDLTNSRTLMASQFLNNAYAQAECTISVSSLLIDQANTRVYNKRQFGLGIRQVQVPDTSAGKNPYIDYRRGFSYYTTYLTRFGLNPTDPDKRSFFEFMFLRLGLVQFDK